eukprot:CFRG2017T1
MSDLDAPLDTADTPTRKDLHTVKNIQLFHRRDTSGSERAIDMLDSYLRESVNSNISTESADSQLRSERSESSLNADLKTNIISNSHRQSVGEGNAGSKVKRKMSSKTTFCSTSTSDTLKSADNQSQLVESMSDASEDTDTDENIVRPKDVNIDDEVLNTVGKKQSVGKADFDILRVLGKGAFAKVFLVKKVRGKQSGKVFAMKVLGKARIVKDDRMITHTKAERHILEEVSHPFIVNLCYAFQTDGKLYLILEFKNGGELFTHLMKRGFFPEKHVKVYAAELVLALSHLHSLGIIYRDLKLENILLDNMGHIALTDFGLSKESMHDPLDRTKSFAGTVEYMAPEMVMGKGYCRTVDWWALGVLIYELLTGVPPFNNPNGENNSHSEIMERIKNNPVEFPDFFSDDLCDFINGMTCKHMSRRLGAKDVVPKDIFGHPWFREINWDDALAKKLPVPFVPDVESDGDTGQFDEYFTTQHALDSPAVPLTSKEELFRGFSFVSPEAHRQVSYLPSPRTRSFAHHGMFSHNNRFGGIKVMNGDASATMNNNSTAAGFRIPRQLGQGSCRDFTIPNGSEFAAKYQLTNKQVGRGAFSVCYQCLERSSGLYFAVKIVPKSSRQSNNEVANLKRCKGFRHVVQMHDALSDEIYHYIVMELLEGGELFDCIKAKTRFTEQSAAEVVYQILAAVKSLHTNGIIHRDIKPENLLYEKRADNADLKLVDFGFSKYQPDESMPLKTPCFTPAYVAPEVLAEHAEYDKSCDVWSVGVIMYTMLCGYPPFDVKNKSSTALYDTMISQKELNFPDKEWSGVTPLARDLVCKMIEVNPAMRITADAALKHEWLNMRTYWKKGAKRKLTALPSTGHMDAKSAKDNIDAYRKIILPKLEIKGIFHSDLAKRRKLKNKSSTSSTDDGESTVQVASPISHKGKITSPTPADLKHTHRLSHRSASSCTSRTSATT